MEISLIGVLFGGNGAWPARKIAAQCDSFHAAVRGSRFGEIGLVQ
jgi:hypothetical protein